MKHLKKLNAKGFAHWIIPAVAVVVIGAIGSYVYLRSSHAATVTQTQCVNTYHGVWKDLTTYGVPHGPCWSTPGAYIINWGTYKTGPDGIDHVPLTGNNAQTGTSQSEKFSHPRYIIIVSGNWQLCGTPSGRTTCTRRSNPFTKTTSAPYYGTGGTEAYAHGGAYSLSAHDYFWANSTGYYITKFSTDTGIYLNRL